MQKIPDSELAVINNWLKNKYGMFDELHQKYRVVWSEDELEQRRGEFQDRTEEGFLRSVTNGVLLLKKYRYPQPRYVLEQLMEVPKANEELLERTSYEPIWTFQDKSGAYLPPLVDACYWIIETIHENVERNRGIKKYRDSREDTKILGELKSERVKKLKEKLFGNESHIADSIVSGTGVVIDKTDFLEKSK